MSLAMPQRHDRRTLSFVDRHDLWSDAQRRAATAVDQAIKRHKLDVVRFSFVDQHGTLRGKTLVASEASRAMRDGVTMTTTLLAKDPSHRTVFPVFTAGGGLNIPEMQGAGDFMMVADPTTFRVLPWADGTGWLLCDIVFTNGKPLPLSTRQLYRDALARLGNAGFEYKAGLEVEFHLYKIEDAQLQPEGLVSPPSPPTVSLTTQGFQYLTESAFRSGRSDHAGAAGEHRGARTAAAVAGGRAWPEPVRIHLRARDRARGRRHDGAVPQRDEAGRRGGTAISSASCAGRDCRMRSPAAGICTSR